MKMYIRAASSISPQKTFGDIPFLENIVTYNSARLKAIEPDYKPYIDPKQIRRMSRIIKMGVAAASDCLQKAEVALPDAIITGTAYGCVEDTGVFITRIIEQQEEMLPPTAFIQSTHNTVAAQIALGLKCHNYNNTFVHKSFSFESALLDAKLLFAECEAETALVGATEEVTDISFEIFNRFGIFKKEVVNTNLYDHTWGTIFGEGAAFFLLTKSASGKELASLDAFTTYYKPDNIEQEIAWFLKENDVALTDIDLVMTGRNGHEDTDIATDELEAGIFSSLQTVNFKHLCGEYPVASSFALWLAANIVSAGAVPKTVGNVSGTIKKVLICNQYQNKYWSLMLVSAC
ncbi:beta-ketoacyl synthase chain length factor [Mucilaginibacter ginkgonis]|uniref:Beta-ketoacyl synthase chain length factor n=1 Tax=Mucilaginibacter ginkgonis TaxID=2682091 RepID=A0A7T7JGP1_9SPHI|nr:beta-ketoacyl synthase chain length factor [Mucilaginibacter ginkgonis]QQL49389.1 beta-ketoacyl synthase chain length factor [Mucilaginibacter ginkgonis]